MKWTARAGIDAGSPVGEAFANDQAGCAKSVFPLTALLSRWQAPAKKIRASDAAETTPPLVMNFKTELELAPQTQVKIVSPPEKSLLAAEKAFGGFVKFTPHQAGKVLVLLGQRAWVDVLDGQTSVKASRFEKESDCATVFKVLEFPLEANKIYLFQITSSEERVLPVLLN